MEKKQEHVSFQIGDLKVDMSGTAESLKERLGQVTDIMRLQKDKPQAQGTPAPIKIPKVLAKKIPKRKKGAFSFKSGYIQEAVFTAVHSLQKNFTVEQVLAWLRTHGNSENKYRKLKRGHISAGLVRLKDKGTIVICGQLPAKLKHLKQRNVYCLAHKQ